MSSVDEGGVTVRREADVVVVSEDGEAGDDVLRAVRAEQAKLDDAWNKGNVGTEGSSQGIRASTERET